MATVTSAKENFFQRAMSVWESAVDSGLKMQTEYAHWLQQTYGNSDSLARWCQESQAAVNETIAKTQESFEEALKVIQQQAQSQTKLVQQTFLAPQGENDSTQPTYREWWEAALETMQTNGQEIFKANSHLLKNWSEWSQKFSDKATDAMANMLQKTTDQAQTMTKAATERVKKMGKQASEN